MKKIEKNEIFILLFNSKIPYYNLIDTIKKLNLLCLCAGDYCSSLGMKKQQQNQIYAILFLSKRLRRYHEYF